MFGKAQSNYNHDFSSNDYKEEKRKDRAIVDVSRVSNSGQGHETQVSSQARRGIARASTTTTPLLLSLLPNEAEKATPYSPITGSISPDLANDFSETLQETPQRPAAPAPTTPQYDKEFTIETHKDQSTSRDKDVGTNLHLEIQPLASTVGVGQETTHDNDKPGAEGQDNVDMAPPTQNPLLDDAILNASRFKVLQVLQILRHHRPTPTWDILACTAMRGLQVVQNTIGEDFVESPLTEPLSMDEEDMTEVDGGSNDEGRSEVEEVFDEEGEPEVEEDQNGRTEGKKAQATKGKKESKGTKDVSEPTRKSLRIELKSLPNPAEEEQTPALQSKQSKGVSRARTATKAKKKTDSVRVEGIHGLSSLELRQGFRSHDEIYNKPRWRPEESDITVSLFKTLDDC